MIQLRLYIIAFLLRDLKIPSVDQVRAGCLHPGGKVKHPSAWKLEQFMQGLRVAAPAAGMVAEEMRDLLPRGAGRLEGLDPLWQAILTEGLPEGVEPP